MNEKQAPKPTRQPPEPLSYSSYLDAKKSVDDRALNQHVVNVLRRELASPPSVTVLEVGAGVGTMVARLAEWNVLNRVDYTLVDVDQEILREAPEWLTRWASSTGRSAVTKNGSLHIVGGAPAVDMTVHFVCAELRQFLGVRHESEPVDLLIANAFLDLVEVPATLPALFDLVAPDGLYWFSINFDGETIFQPEHESDTPLIAVYHRSMDQRLRSGRPAGDCRTGRHLFHHLRSAKARILGAGSSDWVVNAVDGKYPDREGEFIAHILHTIEAELNWRAEVDQTALEEWLRVRRDQLARGELVYIAHQIDFIGRRAG